MVIKRGEFTGDRRDNPPGVGLYSTTSGSAVNVISQAADLAAIANTRRLLLEASRNAISLGRGIGQLPKIPVGLSIPRVSGPIFEVPGVPPVDYAGPRLPTGIYTRNGGAPSQVKLSPTRRTPVVVAPPLPRPPVISTPGDTTIPGGANIPDIINGGNGTVDLGTIGDFLKKGIDIIGVLKGGSAVPPPGPTYYDPAPSTGNGFIGPIQEFPNGGEVLTSPGMSVCAPAPKGYKYNTQGQLVKIRRRRRRRLATNSDIKDLAALSSVTTGPEKKTWIATHPS